MISLDGAKISKSLGNLVLVSRLMADGTDPAAIRLALLAGHYRSDREWTDELLRAAESRLARWRAATALPAGPDAAPVLAGVRRQLADDLATPGRAGHRRPLGGRGACGTAAATLPPRRWFAT